MSNPFYPHKNTNAMRIKSIISVFFLLAALTGCSQEERHADDADSGSVGFSTRGPATGVEILAFRQQSGATYEYSKTLTPNWTLKTGDTYTAKAALLIGKYEFLFYKKDGSATTMTTLVPNTTRMDAVRFTAKQDTGNPAGYYLPVDEIWLPASSTVAHTTYTITGDNNPTVGAKLTRAISQVEVVLKRGTKELDGTFTPAPFTGGTDISSILGDVTLDISGLGTAIGIDAGINATAKTKVTLDISSGTVDAATGFITIPGPFVFPNDDPANKNISVGISVAHADPVTNPTPLTGSASGKAERNRKLQIVIWKSVSAGSHSVDLEVSYGTMDAPIDGDTGIWN